MDYEEIEFICESCGKRIRRVRGKNNNIKEFLCQRCAKKIIETE
jgi:predicted SprT family Zn-dependent metalloprotease